MAGSAGSIPLQECRTIYGTIAKRFLASTDFAKASSIGGIQLEHDDKRQRTGYQNSRSHSRANPTPEQLGTTISYHDLVTLYDTLAKASTPDGDGDLATKFITKLNDAAPRIPVETMHDLWLPFLVSLIPALIDNADPLTNTISLTNSHYQSLYRSLLTRYITKYVGKEPAQSDSLVRPRVTCPDWPAPGCLNCRDLNDFLTNPRQRVERFNVDEDRENHLKQVLDEHNIDCMPECERARTPYTLVITKTFGQQAQALRLWNERKAKAKKIFEEFGTTDNPSLTPQLKILLGSEYESIMAMRDAHIESPEVAAAPPVVPAARPDAPAASASASASASRPTVSATGHVTAASTRSRARTISSGASRYSPPPVAGRRRRYSFSFGDGLHHPPSGIDKERSEMREVMRMARFSESLI